MQEGEIFVVALCFLQEKKIILKYIKRKDGSSFCFDLFCCHAEEERGGKKNT